MPMMTDRRHSCGGHFFKTRLPPFLPSGCFPIIYRLSQPVNQWKVCAVTSRQGKVREARSKPAAARIVPFHAGASTCRNNTVFHSPTGLYAAGFGLSASVPYLSLVTCHVKGKRRYFYPPRAFIPLGRNSGVGRIRRIPFMFAPADHCLTRPSRTLFYFIFSCIYIRQGRTPFYRHTFRTVPVSSLPLPSDFPTAKVGCRA